MARNLRRAFGELLISLKFLNVNAWLLNISLIISASISTPFSLKSSYSSFPSRAPDPSVSNLKNRRSIFSFYATSCSFMRYLGYMSSFFFANFLSHAFTVKSFKCSDSPRIWVGTWLIEEDRWDTVCKVAREAFWAPFTGDLSVALSPPTTDCLGDTLPLLRLGFITALLFLIRLAIYWFKCAWSWANCWILDAESLLMVSICCYVNILKWKVNEKVFLTNYYHIVWIFLHSWVVRSQNYLLTSIY